MAKGETKGSSRRRLLVVDDDHALRSTFCRALRQHHDVHELAHGAAVVPLIKSGVSFDAILLDLEMPIMNGRQTLDLLTRVAPAHAARTLIVTGGARSHELQTWLAGLPAHRVHLKPVNMPRLLATIGQLDRTRDTR
jgi:CheY-like chemotaxis protein